MDGAENSALEDALWREVGRHVYQLRRALDLTQDALARRSKLSEPFIRKLENHVDGTGHRRETLSKVSMGLGRAEEYLYEYRLALAIVEAEGLPSPPSLTPRLLPRPELEPQSELERIVPRIDELIVRHLNEIVVSRLDKVEKEMGEIRDVIYNMGTPVDLPTTQHPNEPD